MIILRLLDSLLLLKKSIKMVVLLVLFVTVLSVSSLIFFSLKNCDHNHNHNQYLYFIYILLVLPYIKDVNGSSLIKGKTITGFSTEGEIKFEVMSKIQEDGVKTVEEVAAEVDAKYVAPETPLAVCVQEDGRVLTG